MEIVHTLAAVQSDKVTINFLQTGQRGYMDLIFNLLFDKFNAVSPQSVRCS